MFELIEREIYVLIYAYNRVVWRLDKIFEEMHILLIGSVYRDDHLRFWRKK